MRKINKVKIFNNDNYESIKIKNELTVILSKYKFNIVENDYDLAIAIGGDGSFLRMVKATNFDSDILYVGINTGTLGFLQEIMPDNIEEFVSRLNNDDFKIDIIGPLETKIYSNDDVSIYYSLNETVVREKDLNICILDIYVNKAKLETFAGDGIIVTTSVGSSAYNLSYGGSLIYNTFHAIEITPMAPINSKAYRNLLSPIILPDEIITEIYPLRKNLLVTVDGENKVYDNVSKIECYVKNKKIKFLRMKEYNYINIVNDKFLTDK